MTTPERRREIAQSGGRARWAKRKFRFCSVEECGVELSPTPDWRRSICADCHRRKAAAKARRRRKRPDVREKLRLVDAAYRAANREALNARERERYWRRKLEGAAA